MNWQSMVLRTMLVQLITAASFFFSNIPLFGMPKDACLETLTNPPLGRAYLRSGGGGGAYRDRFGIMC